jgi:hypothetical protein
MGWWRLSERPCPHPVKRRCFGNPWDGQHAVASEVPWAGNHVVAVEHPPALSQQQLPFGAASNNCFWPLLSGLSVCLRAVERGPRARAPIGPEHPQRPERPLGGLSS